MSRKKQRTCGGKRRFRDREEATRVHTLTSKSQRGKVPCRAYECSRCAGWHLTSWASHYLA